jgi:phage shock protein PspC (stress-responsive transcriptional regulator)
MRIVTYLRTIMEKYGFYVSTRVAEKLGIKARSVRITFIYFTFATLGVGFAVYLIMAFWIKIKDLVYTKRSSVFDL